MNYLLAAKRFIIATITYSFIGLGIVALDIIRELMFGTGLAHSFWQISYDWTPVIIGVIMLAAILGAFRLHLAGVTLKPLKPLRTSAFVSRRPLLAAKVGATTLGMSQRVVQ